MATTLELSQTAVGAINDGLDALTTATIGSQPILVRRCPSSLPLPFELPCSRPLRLQLGASRNHINLLDDSCSLLSSLPFELAFPLHSALISDIQAVAFDTASGRVRRWFHSPTRIHKLTFPPPARAQIAAASDGRIGVWEPTAASAWRVHSSFTAPHSVTALDFAKGARSLGVSVEQIPDLDCTAGTIVAGGDALSVWTLDESKALPRWTKSGTEL